MPTVTATAGAANSNSYVTVAEADTYFDERLQATAWSGEDADDKARAVIQATRRIDQQHFEGEKTTTGQALKFPRIGATDDDGEEFDNAAIPTLVKHATFELALHLLNDDDDSIDTLAEGGLDQFSEVQVGPLAVTVRRGYESGKLPDNVVRLLRPVVKARNVLSRA